MTDWEHNEVSSHKPAERRAIQSSRPPLMGRYQPLEMCGRGGMATVYRARDLQTSEVVAVKLMPVPEDWARLQREVSTLRGIRHPNIVRFIDFRMDERNAAIIMEYLHGLTVGRLLESGEPMPWRMALRLGIEILAGLVPLHAANLIHRDIKPSNLILVDTDDVCVKLLDFGVVKPMNARRITQTGLVVGTPCYMPPEQCAGLPLTPAVDIFALGVVLWQALTGRVPHRGILFVPEWSTSRAEIPAGIREFIETMVQTMPEQRYSDASSCLVALNRLRDDVSRATERANHDTMELEALR